MHNQATTRPGVKTTTTPSEGCGQRRAERNCPGSRSLRRDVALQNALRKRTSGVPTYSVPEAAALLSVSTEHLYRLIQADAFPTVGLRKGAEQGRYVVPAQAIERLLDEATDQARCIEVGEWTATWRAAAAAEGVGS